jgi:multidrug efflux pump subunit AcrA (membrane-fusion protein)
MQDEQARLEKLRAQEIERKVQEQLQIQKQKELEKERKEKEKLESEKKRIADAAKQLLEQQAAAAAAAKAAKEKEEAHLKAQIDAALQVERSKYNAAQSGKKTYTRFSKAHLCKEALEERGIPFTEEVGVSPPPPASVRLRP